MGLSGVSTYPVNLRVTERVERWDGLIKQQFKWKNGNANWGKRLTEGQANVECMSAHTSDVLGRSLEQLPVLKHQQDHFNSMPWHLGVQVGIQHQSLGKHFKYI